MSKYPHRHVFLALDIEPTFHRVAQTNQWNSAVACIASVVKKPINEVRRVAATQFKPSLDGPLSATQTLIPGLLAYYEWWVASHYMEATAANDLPDLALILLCKKPDQFALFHRQRFECGRSPMSYLINPVLGIPEDQQFRMDVEAILPVQYLRICLMSDYMRNFWWYAPKSERARQFLSTIRSY